MQPSFPVPGLSEIFRLDNGKEFHSAKLLERLAAVLATVDSDRAPGQSEEFERRKAQSPPA